jgi:hypothetical protein
LNYSEFSSKKNLSIDFNISKKYIIRDFLNFSNSNKNSPNNVALKVNIEYQSSILKSIYLDIPTLYDVNITMDKIAGKVFM